ncbi:Serine/threonine protein kinase [Phytophthora megakarya]|uniref:Serine/threonine protein kinase n=1 Tax=Phytophthora megakarya TaxID=4795 RepID=A0A225VGQ1_9STRA|nr:Serine/threonine protein kinase [Phytophthora megakarya]
MVSVVDLAVPGAGPLAEVLATISQLSGEMKEGNHMCGHLHSGLVCIMDGLEAKEHDGQPPRQESLDKFVAVVIKFLLCLERYKAKELIHRVVEYGQMMSELRVVNEGVLELFELFDVVMVNWSEQWEHDIRVCKNVLIASAKDNNVVLRSMRDPRAQLDALLTVKFEVERRASQHDKEILECYKSMIKTISETTQIIMGDLPTWFMPLHDIKVELKPFGRGSFGSMHSGVWGQGTNVAIKRFFIDELLIDQRIRLKAEKELNLACVLSHSNILKMFGASHVSSPPFVVWEHATNGNLGVFLVRSDDNKRRMWRLLHQAALGLDYLHSQGVVHGDLKLNNILIGEDGKAKISDFGLSALRSCSTSDRSVPSGLRWSAPECLRRKPNFASDVYSFAMCMIEAVIGEPPFAFLSDDDVRDNVRKGIIPDQPEGITADMWELVVSMTNIDPSERLPLQSAINKLKEFADAELGAECGVQVPVDAEATDSYSTESARAQEFQSEAQDFELSDVEEVNPVLTVESSIPEILLDFELSDVEEVNPVLTVESSIPEILLVIQKDDANCEQELLVLVQVCMDEESRKMLFDLNGVSLLVDVVKNCYSYFGQLCALKCLSWIAYWDCRFSRPEYETLRKSIRGVSALELMSLTKAVTDGTSEDKLRAVICCACVATASDSEDLDDFGIVEIVIPQLRNVDTAISAWAADALGHLAERGVIADEAIVSPLVEFLEAGTSAQQQSAAYTLGHLAGVNAFNCDTIINSGGILCVGNLLETGSDVHKALAAFALGSLATSEDARVAIVNAGFLPLLVEFARAGTVLQREHAAFALGWLSHTDTICELVISCGGVTPLVSLVRSGTADQKKQAALALGNIAVDSNESTAIIFDDEGAISPLVGLLRTGTDEQKENAVRALSNLALNSQVSCVKITSEGAITLLIDILRSGIGVQKGLAALTLGYLGATNKTNCTAIRNAVSLLQSEVDEHQQQAVTALEHLTAHSTENVKAIAQEGCASLISLVRTGTDSQKELATIVLGRLTGTKPNRESIVNQGAIPVLVHLIQSGTDAQKEEAVYVLGRLGKEDTGKTMIQSLGAVDAMKRLQLTGNTAQKRKARFALKAIEGDGEAGTKRRRQDNS